MKILVSKVENHWEAIVIYHLIFFANFILKSPEVMLQSAFYKVSK